jgi:hypothetical protein
MRILPCPSLSGDAVQQAADESPIARRPHYNVAMNVLAVGVSWFAAALIVHLIWWRLSLPPRQSSALVRLFAVSGVFGAVGLIAGGAPGLGLTAPRLVLTALLFGGLALTYLILFSAIEADSPTLSMIDVVRRHGSRGIAESDLLSIMVERSFARVRLNQMVNDGLAVEIDGRLFATRAGVRFASIVVFYRRLIGTRAACALPVNP